MDRPAGARTDSRKWTVLAIASLSTLLGTSDFSIVTIIFPTLTDALGTTTATVIWVGLGYQLTSLAFVLPMGRLGDRFGHKPLFVTGLGIYTGGLALAAVAPGIEALILFRGIQGVGAAMTTALSVALVTSAFPQEERGKAIGTLQSAAGIGLMAGPAVGGLILDAMGWRAIFLLRVPLGLAAAMFALVFMKGGAEQRTGRRFDASGAIALIVGLSAFAVAVTQGPSLGWGSPQVASLALTSALALIVFFLIERRAPYPVVDIGLFKSRPFAVANFLALLYAALSMAVPFLMPFYLMGGLALSASAAGLILLTNPLILMLASPWTGRLSDRYGPRWITVMGMTLYAGSLFLLSTLHIASAPSLVVAFLIVGGLGGALFSTPNTSAIMGAAPSDRIGSVSALIPTLRNIGLIVSLTVGGAIFASAAGMAGIGESLLGGGIAQRGAIVEGVRTAFVVYASLGALGVGVALLRGQRR